MIGQSRLCVIFFLALALLCGQAKSQSTFNNPITTPGPDPWITGKDGQYYLMVTLQTSLTIWKLGSDPTVVTNAEQHVVWTPPANTSYSTQLWAPELHWIGNSWYIYFSADDNSNNNNHRVYVIQNSNSDPTAGTWTFQGTVQIESTFAIDFSTFFVNNVQYGIWSGLVDESNTNAGSAIYIATMASPLKIGSGKTLISQPTYDWEKQISPVNEGPIWIQNGNKMFITYSASNCASDGYSVGLLSASISSNPLEIGSWTKSSSPVLTQNPSGSVYGTGHNSFFTSPDGKQQWVVYHANSASGQGCGNNRATHIQPFSFDSNGLPNFGQATPLSTAIAKPSGISTSSSTRATPSSTPTSQTHPSQRQMPTGRKILSPYSDRYGQQQK